MSYPGREGYFAPRRALRTESASVRRVTFPARQTLTARDRVVVRAMAEAMFAQDGEASGARLDAVVGEVDAYVSAASRIAPLLFFFRACLLERLSIDDRVALLARLERSPIALLSLAFIGWRTVLTLVFYEDPAELRAIGYAGEERLRHKRHLPAFAAVAPPPEESGVRLRDDDATPAPATAKEVA
jgi:hypothetical protein